MGDASGRTALLRATIVVVASGGLRALTYRAVAAEAGVSHGLVRHHFGTRDQLIAEAMELAIDESLRGSNMLESGLTVSEFAAGIETLAERESGIQSFQYELLLETRRRPELRPFAKRHYEAYRAAIHSQLARLGVSDPGLTDLIWFTLDGIVFKQLVAPGDVGPAVQRMRQLIESSISHGVSTDQHSEHSQG
ncbi:TetR/AcrR family transcriptional regulator [Leucobacter coleopterorum]|uniref:TetR/AcrR family transcriptional regulator n=1 Tax=Leucobacter coleopterorum TaxID=2714933 RepID=A0ABX6JU11_9MICO|nr:TetR/AcrR family transcriptional regulator [Leucobacter coleopterorum]QIM17770.1 TetR/AcrR family transcriptional regulator [Leucobacter coleopterorum]